MQADVMSPEMSLARIRQIASEESAAVQAGDAVTLCRLTELLPHSIADYERAVANSSPKTAIDNMQVWDEIRDAHEQAERYLQEQMRSVKTLLQQCATARRALTVYGQRTPAPQVDNRS